MAATTMATGEMEVGWTGTKGVVAISGDGWRDVALVSDKKGRRSGVLVIGCCWEKLEKKGYVFS